MAFSPVEGWKGYLGCFSMFDTGSGFATELARGGRV